MTPDQQDGGPELSAAGLRAAGEMLLADDYDTNRASSPHWNALAPTSQEQYLLKARQIVTAYLTAEQRAQ